jgi:hypothetical protein
MAPARVSNCDPQDLAQRLLLPLQGYKREVCSFFRCAFRGQARLFLHLEPGFGSDVPCEAQSRRRLDQVCLCEPLESARWRRCRCRSVRGGRVHGR